jgi:hypothetical protein
MSVRSTIARSAIIAHFLAICLTAESGIDLTASVNEYVSEGIKYQKLTFQTDKQRIEYSPPPGWNFRGSTARLQLTPPKRVFAEALIEALPLAAPQPLDEKLIKALEQQFIASLPPDSQFITVVAEEQNPLLLDGSPTFEVILSYESIGQKFLKSALFVHLADTQLIFRLTGRKDDFDALHADFKRSILSWHGVEVKPSAPEAVAP